MSDSKRMMKGFLQATNYLNSHLNEGEYPIYRAHLSWIPIFTRQVPFMLVGGIAGGCVWAFLSNFWLGLAIYLGAAIIGLFSQVPFAYRNVSTDILLTNQGIHSKKKLFAISDDQFTRYAYINDAELEYSNILQRVFEYGDVKIATVATGDDYRFCCVAKPQQLKAAVRQAQSEFGSSGMPYMQQQQMPPQQPQGRQRRAGGR